MNSEFLGGDCREPQEGLLVSDSSASIGKPAEEAKSTRCWHETSAVCSLAA